MECPECPIENFVVFGEHGTFSTLDAMYFQGNQSGRVPLLPADPPGRATWPPARARSPPTTLAAKRSAWRTELTDALGLATLAQVMAAVPEAPPPPRVDEAVQQRGRATSPVGTVTRRPQHEGSA